MPKSSDAPAFRMEVSNGHLVPATPYDQERLNSFPNGLDVRVRFVRDRDSVWIRKWWAVITLAVKQCKTPWKTAEEASDVLKLMCGVSNSIKVMGVLRETPRSLSELSDEELRAAVELMEAILYRTTGVDPQTLRREAKVENEQ